LTRDEYMESTDEELVALAEAVQARERREWQRQAYAMASLFTLLVNQQRTRGQPRIEFTVEDFMPHERRDEPQSAQTMAFMVRAFAGSGWGELIKPERN